MFSFLNNTINFPKFDQFFLRSFKYGEQLEEVNRKKIKERLTSKFFRELEEHPVPREVTFHTKDKFVYLGDTLYKVKITVK